MAEIVLASRIQLDVAQFRASVRSARREIAQFNREAQRATRATTAANTGLIASTRRLGQQFVSLRTLGIGAFGAIAVSSTRTSVQMAENFKGIQIGFETILGSSQAAQQELEFLRQEADRLGTQFIPLAASSRGLSAALQNTELEGQGVRDIFRAVTTAARVLNLSTDDTRGALRAVEQIASRGTVAMEELRLQLAERVPGAFRIAAEAMGLSTAELTKLVSTGQLAATDFLPRFAEALENRFGAGVEAASQTFTAANNRFLTGLNDLRIAVGNAITGNQRFIDSQNAAGRALSELAREIDPTPIEAEITAIEKLEFSLEKATGTLNQLRDAFLEIVGLPNFAPTQAQLAEELARRNERLNSLLEEQNVLAEIVGDSTQDLAGATKEAEQATERARQATERYAKSLASLTDVRAFSVVQTEIANLEQLLNTAQLPGEVAAIRAALEGLDDEARALRLGPLLANIADEGETAAEVWRNFDESIDPGIDALNDLGDTAVREGERVQRAAVLTRREWDLLPDVIDGVAESFGSLNEVVALAVREQEELQRQTEETNRRFRDLTGIRPLEEIASDVELLEQALEDAQTPREIRAIEDALRELRSEATETSREMQIAFEEANNAIDRSIRDFVNGELDLLETLEDAFSETLTRMAQEAARTQLEPLLQRGLGSLFGGGGRGAQGGAGAGTVPVSPGGFLQGGTVAQGGGGQGAAAGAGGASAGGAFGLVGLQVLQGIQTTNEVISGLRSDNRRERVEARGRTALIAGGVLLGGVGGLLLDQIDQQFAGGSIARAVGGLLSGDAPSLSVTIATAVSDELALASGEIENLTGSLSTPFGRLLVTDIDDISKKAAREVARFVQSIDRDAAAFLNEAQIGAVSRALNLTTFDQSFGQRIDEDNLADILVERFGSIFEAAAAATPDLLAVSPSQFRGNIFAGIDEDDLDAVQQRVTEVGQLLQTITRLSTDRDITQVELALRAIEDTFRPLRQAADDFGLSLQNLAVLQQQATQDLRDAFTENIGDALLAIQDPLALANLQLDRRREVLIREANALGLSTANIEALIAAERRLLEIREEQLQIAERVQVGNLERQIEALSMAGTEISPFVSELQGLRDLAEQLRIEALAIEAALGPGVVQIPDIGRALAQGTQSLARRFREEVEAEALAITDPFGFELLELDRAFELALEAARELQIEAGILGLTDAVEDLFDIQRMALDAQIDAARAQERAAELSSIQTQLDPINDFLQRLEIGAGTFTPAQVLTNTQAAFERALQGTDVFDVVTLGQQLIDASREVNTSAPAFFDTLSNVQSQVLDFADAIAANATSLTDVNQSVQLQTQAVVNLLEDLLARAVENNADNTNIRNLLELTLAGTA